MPGTFTDDIGIAFAIYIHQDIYKIICSFKKIVGYLAEIFIIADTSECSFMIIFFI